MKYYEVGDKVKINSEGTDATSGVITKVNDSTVWVNATDSEGNIETHLLVDSEIEIALSELETEPMEDTL